MFHGGLDDGSVYRRSRYGFTTGNGPQEIVWTGQMATCEERSINSRDERSLVEICQERIDVRRGAVAADIEVGRHGLD